LLGEVGVLLLESVYLGCELCDQSLVHVRVFTVEKRLKLFDLTDVGD